MYNPSGNPFHFTFKFYPESDNLSPSPTATFFFFSFPVYLLLQCSFGWILTLRSPPTPCFGNHAIYHYPQACIYPFLGLLSFPFSQNGWPSTQFKTLTLRRFLPTSHWLIPEEGHGGGAVHLAVHLGLLYTNVAFFSTALIVRRFFPMVESQA